MDHPLRASNSQLLRKRVVQFLENGLAVRKNGNIVFVCGGNESKHLRKKFQKFCSTVPEFDYQIFFPEFAIKSYFNEEHIEPFNIAEFERLVGELSHAIVIFPEAAGSYAETGYFSAVKSLAEKTILVLDAQYQEVDSFISMGPQAEYDRLSQFKSTIQFDYKKPTFQIILSRLKRRNLGNAQKALPADDFRNLSAFDYYCLIAFLFDFLLAATFSDVNFILTALFKNRHSKEMAKQLTSILVGAGHLELVGKFGHFRTIRSVNEIVFARVGKANELKELRLEILEAIRNSTADFQNIAGVA